MLTRLQIQNYRGIKGLDVALQPFQVLIGPNGSGKSTFFDAILFLRDILSDGVVKAIHKRADYYEQLTFGNNPLPIAIAIEATIPERFQNPEQASDFEWIRYELGIKTFNNKTKYSSYFEHIQLLRKSRKGKNQILQEPEVSQTYRQQKVLDAYNQQGAKTLFKNNNGTLSFDDESRNFPTPYSFKRPLLADDLYWTEEDHPIVDWFRHLLLEVTGKFELESEALRSPQRLGDPDAIANNGENFPFVFESFKKDQDTYKDWLSHIQSVIPGIIDVQVVERPEDRKRYLVIEYQNGEKVPSWLASDGTLKFLFLTMLAYSNLSIKGREEAVNMIEEVENGLHPQAIESLLDSLSSVWDTNVMVTTHSPVVLNYKDMKPEDLLIFNYSENQGIQVQTGSEHPGVKEWKNNLTLREMLSSGIL